MAENELKHHGVPGMKWGVRRTKKQLGYKTASKSPNEAPSGKLTVSGKPAQTINSKIKAAGKPKVKSDSKDKQEQEPQPKKKTAKEMTDEELKSAVSRLELERRYNDLNPKQVSNGKKFVDRAIKNVVLPATEEVAKQTLKTVMSNTVDKTLASTTNKK